MPYDIEASTDNCYEGTTCLINKLDIRDEEQTRICRGSPDAGEYRPSGAGAVSYTHLDVYKRQV